MIKPRIHMQNQRKPKPRTVGFAAGCTQRAQAEILRKEHRWNKADRLLAYKQAFVYASIQAV